MIDNPDYMSRVFFDLFNHASTGYLLADYFFPDSGFLKKSLRGVIAGFLPDIDFLLPYLHHRSFTHGPLGFLLPLGYSLFEKEKAKSLLFCGTAVASHFLIDSFKGFEEHIPYALGMASLLLGNYLYRERISSEQVS